MSKTTKFIDILVAFLSFLFLLFGTLIGIFALLKFDVKIGIIAVLMIVISISLTKIWKILREVGDGM